MGQRHVCTFRHAQRAAYRTAISAAQILVKNCSTCTNLLESFNDWTLYLQDKQQVLIVYIDFWKAFDVVSHEKLFTRLHAYGIQGELLLWLKQFLHSSVYYISLGYFLLPNLLTL